MVESRNDSRLSNDHGVRLWVPGKSSRRALIKILAASVILITVVGSVAQFLPGIIATFASLESSPSSTSSGCTLGPLNSTVSYNCSSPPTSNANTLPNTAVAAPVPDLSLPHTVLTNLGNLINAGGVIQDSSQNLTLYNAQVVLRLLGGPNPHDEILGVGEKVVSSWAFWGVESLTNDSWTPLQSLSTNFTIIGTNTTGTFVNRNMHLSNGAQSGNFLIIYEASSAGPLKWNLQFTPTTTGSFRFVFLWQNITATSNFSPVSRQFQTLYGKSNYAFHWDDVPSNLNTTASTFSSSFHFSINLGNINKASVVQIDPSLVGSAAYPTETAFTFQRKIFYEPHSARYWAFYPQDVCGYTAGLQYSSSTDGITWSNPTATPGSNRCFASAPPLSLTAYDVFNSGTAVVITWPQLGGSAFYGPDSNCFTTRYFCLNYVVGNIAGSQISWGEWWTPILSTFNHCDSVFLGNTCQYGTRYVYVTPTSTGKLAFSYNAYANTTSSQQSCNPSGQAYTESDVGVAFFDPTTPNNPSTIVNAKQNSLCVSSGSHGVDISDQDRSVVLPADSQGGVRIIFQSCSGCSGNPSLLSERANFQGGTVNNETITSTLMNTDGFSAIVDPNYGTHVAYATTDGRVAYDYRPAGSGWMPTSLDIFNGVANSPTISVDYSTNDLYVAAIVAGSPTSSIIMKSKGLAQNWTDVSSVYPVMGRKGPLYLTSNAISASSTNASQILLLWTEGPTTSGTYNVTFASVPIQTVWSPYAVPTDPWDNNGISPYGQYFANLAESVSPMTGLLTVVQTDLSVPGRGIDLSITRAYTEPYSFLNNQPYLYEKYPWAPMGDGWQLNFPWMNNTSAPLYIHLWNGEAYRIPYSFWKGPIANFENHQGENFRLVRNTDNTVVLYNSAGATYNFNNTSHQLTKIIDATGNNTISFTYSNSVISCITDTAGRAFTFSYSAGLLSSIQQVSGSCSNPASTLRSVLYYNDGQSLTSVTDPANRITSYLYQAASGTVTPWLLSRVTYPTGSFSNYTYAAWLMGTTANSYRVTKQYVGPSLSLRVKESDFQYANGAGDRVNNSTVVSYNGTATQPVRFTSYSFSFAGIYMNVSDGHHIFVRGIQDRFGVNGEVPREIVLVTDGQGHIGSYTNYYRHDLWGNLIYSRSSINPTAGTYHERFDSYYNDGLQPGFNAFQDTFSQNQGTMPDNSWSVQGGQWQVQSGVGFADNNFTSGWTTEVNNAGSPSEVTNGDTIQLTASFTSGQAGYYRVYKTLSIPINGTLFPLVVVRLKSSVAKNLLRVELRDGTTYFDPTDGKGDLWKSSLGWTVAVLNVAGHNNINMIKVGITSEGDTSISGVQTGTFDYVFISNEVPSSQVDTLGQYSGTETTGQQEANFAWADIAKSDLSLQANVFVTNQINASDQRIGIFVHHSTSDYKWMLVLHNTGSGMYLEITDEFYGSWPSNGDPGMAACPLSYGQWYTFNMTVHGLLVTGWANAPGMTTCNVWRYFSAQSPAYSGTGFGLYAGGYAAKFDNVTVTTVSPSITGTGFSRSFIANGAPGPSIHTSLAGIAQLQNGTGTIPVESYYSYYSWGGLNQQENRYDPISLGIDGSATAGCGHNTNSCSTIFSTSHANDVVIVYTLEVLDLQTSCTFGVTDTAGLTWNYRAGVGGRNDGSTGGYRDQIGEFWAKSSGILSSDTITESISGCAGSYGGEYNGLEVFGITGANFNTPFDPNSSLPGTANGQSNTPSKSISTSNSGDMIIGVAQQSSYGTLGAGNGFTSIFSGGAASEYQLVISPVTNLPVAFSDTASYYWETIADAIQPASAGSATQWLTNSRTYDVFGNPKIYTDFMSNTTQYTFSSTYNNAYVTQVVAGPTNAQIMTSYTYNFTTGNVLSITDPMNNVTNYQNDNLDRTTRITYPTSSVSPPIFVAGWNSPRQNANSGSTTQTLTICNVAGGCKAGDTIVVNYWQCCSTGQSLSSVTDNQGNAYSEIVLANGANGNYVMADVWGTVSIKADTTSLTVTVTYPDTSHYRAIFVQQYRNVLAFGATHFTGQSSCTSTSESLTTTKANSVVAIAFDIGFMTGMSPTGGQSASNDFHYSNPAGWGLFLWDSTISNAGSHSWTWSVSGCGSSYQSVAIELLGAPAFLAYKYVDGSNYVDTSNENGWLTRQIYNGLGQLSTVDRLQNGASYSNATSTYDLLNGVDRQTDPMGNNSYYQYDTIGRLLNVTKPDRTATLQTYNDYYGWVRLADEYGKYRCSLYDRLGRLISVYENASATCQAGLPTTYSYDEMGDLVRATNGNGYSTTYSYDNLGRLTGMSRADGTFETYKYDKNGNLIQKIDPKTTKTLYSYDSLNRPKTITVCGTPITSTSYTYDKNSNVLTIQNQNATITYTYDSRNRPNSENYDVNLSTRPVVDLGCSGNGGTSTTSGGATKSYKVTYSYAGEELSGIVYPTTGVQNIAVNYTYDALGRPLTVYSPSTSLARFSYFRNDEIKGLQYGNGLTMNYTYDPVSRILVEQLNNTSLHTTLLKLSYSYNSTGTVSSVTGQVNGVTVNEQYKYDALHRLTNSTISSQGVYNKIWYTYDNVGNRLKQNINGTLTSYLYALSNNELASSSAPSKSSTYNYDANGNLVSKSVTSGGTVTWTYTWDSTNRLLAVSNGTIQGKYAYDDGGRLVESIEGPRNTYFAYTGSEMLWQNGTDFIYAGATRIAWASDSSSYQIFYYYHPDELGSVRLVTKTDDTVYFADSYQPFGLNNGTPTCTSCQPAPPFQFQGMPYSARTSLYYDYQRWYDPTIGRFISNDPDTLSLSSPQGLNRYIALLDSPTNYIDPNGASPVASNSGIATILAVLFEWLSRPQNIPGTSYDVVWGGTKPEPFHTFVEVHDPSAPTGVTRTVWAADTPSQDDPFYHKGGRAGSGAFTHEGYDNPMDPRIGFTGEGIGQMAVAEGASHGLLILGAALSAWDIYSAYRADLQAGDGYSRTIQAVGEQGAGWAGAYAGAEILGGYGLEFGFEFGGPPGAVVGGLIGAAVGSILGFMFGQQAFDNLVGPGAQGPYNGPPPCNELGIENSVFQNSGEFCSGSGQL
jgi:RHS repeat-associated protein